MHVQKKQAVAIPRAKPKLAAHPTSSSSSSLSTDEARWRLVLAHTPTTEFLYAVLSTGIYCRTTCPSRRPRRANVRFFDTAPGAVAAGFRACRRCRPESTDSSHASPRAAAEKQISSACEYIRQRKGEAQLLDIAAHVGLSPRYFHGLFKQVLGTTPGAYAATVRQESLTPAAAVQSSTPCVTNHGHTTDLGYATDTAPLGTVGNAGACDLSFMGSLPVTDDWLSGYLTGAENMYIDQGSSSEWSNDFDLDFAQFLDMDNGTLSQLVDTYTPDYVDPSLLGS